ncbi:hypothetical protein, partial [Janthinobacterium agaricidamnosum]|uniref:hypothetical protein n=1 Tax=Janthinobacterium agaricidamnosum TaxID=55508 RepID=UPI001C3F2542
MPKKRQHRSEKYIHIEERNGAYRAKVTVSHQKDSNTFSTWDESMRWARQRRQAFLDSQDANQGAPVPAPLAVPAQVGPIYAYPFTYHAPPAVKLVDVF